MVVSCVGGHHLLDHAAAEAARPVVEDGVLTRRDGALRLIEMDADRAARPGLGERGLDRLAMAHSHAAAPRRIEGPCEPMEGPRRKTGAREQRVIASLHDNQSIARGVLRRDVPGLLRGVAPAADRQSRALADRVEREAAVLPQLLAVARFEPGA